MNKIIFAVHPKFYQKQIKLTTMLQKKFYNIETENYYVGEK